MSEEDGSLGRVFKAMLWPLFMVAVLWGVFWYDSLQGVQLTTYGVFPRTKEGALGILTYPFIHGDLNHIINNSIPLLVLGWSIFYFYREVAFKVFFWIWIMSGVWLWLAARDAWHIGASGVIYGLVTFVFISGILRKNVRLMALSLFIAFLYGSMVWGVLPIDYKVSWEGHLWGSVAGLVMAWYYRKEGTQRTIYQWELEEEMEEGPGEGDDDPSVPITYTYVPKEEGEE